MAYACLQDLIDAYGEAEVIRLSVPAGQPLDAVYQPRVESALADADALIDSYLGKRYATPIDVAPPVIRRAARILARHTLMTAGESHPSETAAADQKQVIAWLADIARGVVVLDLREAQSGDESYAQARGRDPIYGDPASVCAPNGQTFWQSGSAWPS